MKKVAVRGFWTIVPMNLGMKYFQSNDDKLYAAKFFQFKTGKSLFLPECWRQNRMSFCTSLVNF